MNTRRSLSNREKMSYTRSPRAVCSTTIGTRFNALSFTLSPRPGASRSGAHELLEGQRLVARLRAPEQEVDHLILENAGLDLIHHATVRAVELRGLGRLLVRRRELLDSLLYARRVEPDLMMAHKLLNQEADRHAPLRERREALAGR